MIDPAKRTEIRSVLGEVAREENVAILFAVESGSRAWQFASPDSDYDVRFLYARPRDWYLSIEPGRDVIERPISGDLDVNGWDLRKALGLLVKSNPVLLELIAGGDLPAAVSDEIDALVRKKAAGRELGVTDRNGTLDAFIAGELAMTDLPAALPIDRRTLLTAADAFFRRWLDRPHG
jgi:predicted nucleotidyltransferase